MISLKELQDREKSRRLRILGNVCLAVFFTLCLWGFGLYIIRAIENGWTS